MYSTLLVGSGHTDTEETKVQTQTQTEKTQLDISQVHTVLNTSPES